MPHRCGICGAEVRVEPSVPAGDAPCPSCGSLLWWFRERLGDVGPETSFAEDLRMDSLDVVEMVMEAEDEFGVTIPDEDHERIRTVADAIRYILRLRSDRA